MPRPGNFTHCKFNWQWYKKNHPILPVPTRRERENIRISLGLPKNVPFPRCPGKGQRQWYDPFRYELEKKGDFSHSAYTHRCEICRCKHTAGWGTPHYGVGYCYYHDLGKNNRKLAQHMAIAIQQGYPADPVKYRSDRDYIEKIKEMADEANSRLNLNAELDLLRAHLLELEELYSKKDASGLTMKGHGGAVPMTDDVKIDRVVKLVKAVGEIAKQSYVITENEYVHVDECKIWLWGIYQMLEGLCKKLLLQELKPDQLLTAIQSGMKNVTLPRTGRRK